MAISYNIDTSVDALAARLTASFQSSVEEAIRKALMKQAETLITEIARGMARNLSGRVATYREAADGLKVSLIINGVPESIKD